MAWGGVGGCGVGLGGAPVSPSSWGPSRSEGEEEASGKEDKSPAGEAELSSEKAEKAALSWGCAGSCWPLTLSPPSAASQTVAGGVEKSWPKQERRASAEALSRKPLSPRAPLATMDSMTDRGYSSSASFTLPGGLSWCDGGAGSTQPLRTPPSPQGCQGEGGGARASPLPGAPTGTANKDHARGLLDLLHIFKAWGERQQRGEPMARLPWPDSPWREPAAGRAASASEISPNGWEVWGREPPGVPHF
ncbi:zinc finger protein AEBP2-like [Chroicocephalus ridibundus]|uniref:zinc finger protein AEBP2-like n=1 Tax=Chroicocephalus ridibundus TaxID=1192867 RepID=UPI002FDD551D